VDPKLGRIALPKGAPPAKVEVAWSYSFSGDVGAGPYDRRDHLRAWLDTGRQIDFQIGVSKRQGEANPADLVATLGEALLAWKTYASTHPKASGLIAIMDNDTYRETLTGAQRIEVPAGCALAIVAAGWPVRYDAAQGKRRIAGEYEPSELRPHLSGDIEIYAAPGPSIPSLIIDGL